LPLLMPATSGVGESFQVSTNVGVRFVQLYTLSTFSVFKQEPRSRAARCSMLSYSPNDSLIVICFSLRKVTAVIAPVVIYALKADWM